MIVFLSVLGEDTIVSIPENMMEAAVIRKTAPMIGLGIPASTYAILGHRPYSKNRIPATCVTRREATPVAATMPIFWV